MSQIKRPSNEKTRTKKTTSKPDTQKAEAIQNIASQKHHEMIATAAYFIAEKHGFKEDTSMDDWLQAEVEVNKGTSGVT